jgi:hypothetical protein
MRKKAIHKVVIVRGEGDKHLCGAPLRNCSSLCPITWRGVTCKRCLKKRKPQGKGVRG